jgi:hypothetical protein
MSFRTTYILMGVAGLMVAALMVKAFMSKPNPTAGKGFVFDKLQALGTKPEDITHIEIETTKAGAAKLVFERDGKKGWKMTQPVQTRVNGYSVDEIARSLLDAKKKTKGVEIRDKKTHDLESPPLKVTLKTATGQSATLSVGKVVDETSSAYVLSTDLPGDKPLAVDKFAVSALLKQVNPKEKKEQETGDLASMVKTVEDFRQTKLLSAPSDAVADTQSVTIRGGKNELSLTRDSGDNWKFLSPAGFGEVETTEAPPNANVPPNPEINNLRKLLTTVYDLQVASAKDFDDAPADLKKMGLVDNPEMVTIQLARRTPAGEAASTDTVSIGKPVEGQEKYYARVSGDAFVAKVDAAQVRSLLKAIQEPKNLRSHDLVRLSLPRIDAIDVDVGGVNFELRSPGSGIWILFDPSGNRYAANPVAVNHLLESLNRQGRVIDFPPSDLPDANLGVDPKSRAGEVRIWYEGIVPQKKDEPKKDEAKKDEAKKDGAKKEEPKKEAPTLTTKPNVKGEPSVRIAFGKDTGTGIYVRRTDGSGKLDAVMPQSLFTDVVKRSYLDYIEPSLRPFTTADVTRINFNRGADAYELAKDGNDWKFVTPARYAGKAGDAAKIGGLLEQMSRMRPSRVVSDAPTPEQIKTWKVGDAGSVMKLTLTDKAGKATVYYFGEGVGSEQLNVYFRTPEEKFVYELPKIFLDNFAQGALLDPVVYRIDRAKLKGLRMRGWADSGAVVTRELELKDGKWTFKPKADYEPDQEKVDNFLADALAPRAEAFFLKTPPKPEHALDTSKGALQIDFLLEGDKIVSLMLGGPDKDGKSIFALTSELPGDDLFTLLKDRFKSLRDKPTIFKKD